MGTYNEVTKEIIVDIGSQEAAIKECLKQINKLKEKLSKNDRELSQMKKSLFVAHESNDEIRVKLEAIESNKVVQFSGEYDKEERWLPDTEDTGQEIHVFGVSLEDRNRYTVTISKEAK